MEDRSTEAEDDESADFLAEERVTLDDMGRCIVRAIGGSVHQNAVDGLQRVLMTTVAKVQMLLVVAVADVIYLVVEMSEGRASTRERNAPRKIVGKGGT